MSKRGNDYRRDEEEEEDEEIDEHDYKTQKDAILFAIDVSHSMLKPPPASDHKKADKDSAMAASLKSVYQIMQQRIISQPKDMVGILLFGTEKSKFRDDSEGSGSLGYPHCYLFMDLDVPSADDVRSLKALVEEGEDPDEVLVPTTEVVTMANVLFCANQIFTTNAPNFGSRRLFIITDNDDPVAGDKGARSSAAVRAKDLYDLGVIIELFPVSRGDEKFDLSKFYDDIIYRDPATEEGSGGIAKTSKSGDGITLLASLISNINSKQTAKRAFFSNLPFEVAPGLVISVKGYIALHRQQPARTCYIWLDGETPQLATSETTKIEEGSARGLEASEIKKAYKFGGEYVYFTPEEQQSLKKWDMGLNKSGTGLRIIGFKPRQMLQFWQSVKRSYFIFPTEESYVGSTRVFSALWQKLLSSKKMAIAWFVPRINANPLLVAILPSKPQSDEKSGTGFLPAGLWLYALPFADDLRSVDRKSSERCSNELTDLMRKVVENLQLPKAMYNPSKYPNPSLQWHYKILQALALDEEVPEHPEDATTPKYKAINNRVGGYMVEFKESLAQEAAHLSSQRALKHELDEDDDAEARPSKRTKSAPAKPAATKKAAGTASMTSSQLKLAVQQGTHVKLTVVELKDILASRGVSTSGNKADLLERLEQLVEENA